MPNPGPSVQLTPNSQQESIAVGNNTIYTFATLPPASAYAPGFLAITSDMGLCYVNIVNGLFTWVPLAQSSINTDIIYLSQFPGIDPTGTINSRAAVNSALQAAARTNATLMWDCPVYINIGTNPNAPIFVSSNTNVQFTNTGKIYSDGLGLPTFCFINCHDCTWKDVRFQYCAGTAPSANGIGSQYSFGALAAPYGATSGPVVAAASGFNTTQLTN